MDSPTPAPTRARPLSTTPTPAPVESIEIACGVVRRAHAIAPSQSLLRLEAELRRGDAGARRLGQLIEGSPALAALVLRMANSAFYAPREPVVGLNRAIVLLGDTVLRQLVLTSLVMSRQSARRSHGQALAAARLMGDAVRAAVVCRTLAELTGIATPDEAFAAGLLHDVGHVYLLDDVGEAYAGYLLDPTGLEAGTARELALARTSHADVGAVFAHEWNLPAAVATVLREHHRAAPHSLAALVAASDWLVRELNPPAGADPGQVAARAEAALADVGLDRERWTERVPSVRDGYAELLSLLETVIA